MECKQVEADDLTLDPDIAQDLDVADDVPMNNDPDGDPDDAGDSQSSEDHSLWISSVTYSLSHPPCTGRTDWTTHDTLHRSIAQNLEVSHHDLQAVYHVKSAPEDLTEHYTQAFVALLHWDAMPGELYSLVLLDVGFFQHQPLRQPEVVRAARLIPRHITRSQLLQFLGLEPYCRLTQPQGCLVWLNERLQLTQFPGHLPIQNGDYIRVAVPPTADLDSDISTRGAAAACFRGNSINDVVIWHHTTGLDQEYLTLLPVEHPGHTDDNVLMQTSSPGAHRDYDFDPAQEWRNALHPLWRAKMDAPAWGQSLPQAAVFYLDHHRVLRMDDYRVIDLPMDFLQWQELILQAWSDQLDDAPCHIDLVYPEPLTMNPKFAAFLIITQHQDPTKASIMLSLYDRHVGAWSETHFALVVPRLTMKAHLIEIAGLFRICHPRGSQDCTLACGAYIYTDAEIIATQMGGGLSLEVHRGQPACTSEEPVDDAGDSTSLLQAKLQAQFHHLGQVLQQRAYCNWLDVCSLEDDLPLDLISCKLYTPIEEYIEDQYGAMLHHNPLPPVLPQLQVPPIVLQLIDLFNAALARPEHHDVQVGVLTWYLSHLQAHRCNLHRFTELPANVEQWVPTLTALWQDEIDPTTDVSFYVVHPEPYEMEFRVAAHLILVQHEVTDMVATEITVYDNGLQDQRPHRFATLLSPTIHHEHVLQAADRDAVCALQHAHCQSHWGWQDFTVWPLQQARNGYALTLVVQRYGATWQTSNDTSLDSEDAWALQLLLADLLPPATKVVFLVPGHYEADLPAHLEMPDNCTAHDVQLELRRWGHKCTVHQFGQHDKFLCLPENHVASDFNYIYANHDLQDPHGAFLHTSPHPLDELAHMKLLHTLGYFKAVTYPQPCFSSGYILVHFEVHEPVPDDRPCKEKQQKPWPAPHWGTVPQGRPSDLLKDLPALEHDCQLASADDLALLAHLLESSSGILCELFEELNLPETCRTEFHQCARGTDCDRWLIYTDGSSGGAPRWRLPDHPGDEEPVVDSWAFLVVGEKYQPLPGEARFTLVGWLAHPVLYDPDCIHHVGSTKLGAELAEREALLWAGLWRLGQNCYMPTVFRPDSLTTGRQAFGQCGASAHDQSFQLLRGVFQTLQALLPDDLLQFHHVVSHCNDPFNEFVDYVANEERKKSYYLDRQRISIPEIGPLLPYAWMFFDTGAGLPQLCAEGFDASAPALPPRTGENTVEATCPVEPRPCEFKLAFASINVASLSQGPSGYSGKLDYLRSQFKAHGFHLAGIQESRAAACSSTVDKVYRLSSGHRDKQGGVELWVNLDLPFAWTGKKAHYLRPADFTVLFADHRKLLIRLAHPLQRALLVVAYAPQSGRPRQEREQWWQDLAECVQQHRAALDVFVMIDANATTGPGDDVHVLRPNDDLTSDSTEFFRGFLHQADLCVPSSGPAHTGPHSTWTCPTGRFDRRIDYVLVPSPWASRCQYSAVVDSFDLGHLYDHMAVGIELAWKTHSLDLRSSSRSTPSIDRRAILDTDLDSQIRRQPVPCWSTNIEQHIQVHDDSAKRLLKEACGTTHSMPKKPFITSDIWTLRTEKLAAKKRLKGLQHHQRQDLLRRCFLGLQQKLTADHEAHRQFAITSCCMAIRYQAHLVSLTKQLRQRLAKAKQTHLQSALEALPSTAAAGDILTLVHHCHGPTNPKKRGARPLPILDDANGQPCSTPTACLNRWIEYFGAMEGGVRMSQEELRTLWINNLEQFTSEKFQEPLSSLPTLLDLEAALRRVPAHKATGPDGIPGEFCHRNPAALARAMYCQLLKLVLHGQEALTHKQGILTALWKGKGAQRDVAAYRSILVSNHCAKALHRTLRSHQCSLYEAYLQSQQIGGRRKVPVSLGTHMVRAFQRSAVRDGHSHAVIFLDLKEAFYRIVRPLALDTTMTDEDIGRMADRLHLDDSTLQELHAHLRDPNAGQQAHLPWHMRKYLAALHTDTHFAFRGQLDFCRTTIGTRPGDSFADVVFGYVWARVLHKFEAALAEANLLEFIPDEDKFHMVDCPAEPPTFRRFLGPCWMDDLAVCIRSPTAKGIEAKAGHTIGLLLDLCAQHGMTPNVQPGKTEVMLSFKGQGSRLLKERYYSPAGSGTLTVVCETATVQVNVVAEYLHLGALAHHSSTTGWECKRRLGIGHQAFTAHRRLLYHNQGISFDKRRQIFESLVLSKVFYGMELWTFPTPASEKQFHSSVLRLYRRLGRLPHDAHLQEADIITATQLPTPATLLRRQRLRYLVTLIQCGLAVPWGLLHDDQEWMQLLRSDLCWMHDQLARTSHLPDPLISFGPWIQLLREHPGYWKKLVTRAVKHDTLQHVREHQVKQFHARALHTLEQQALIAPGLQPPQPRLPREVFGCMCCQMPFRSKGGEGAHMNRSHNIVAEVRKLFDTTSCPACLKEYHTYSKVKAHLHASSTCRTRLQQRGHFCHPAPGPGSLRDAQLARRHNGCVPVLQGEGPQPSPPHQVALPPLDQALWDGIAACLVDSGPQSTESCEAALRALSTTLPISWTLFGSTLDAFLDHITDEELDICGRSRPELAEVWTRLRDPDTWPFLRQADRLPVHSAPPELWELENDCIDRALQTAPEGPPPISRPIGRYRVILHAYSGRRRPGDVQFYMDKIAEEMPEITLLTVSVDIVVDTTWGDIMRPATRDFWITNTKSGLVVGILAGPPCNTWSVARNRAITGSRRSPRTVRTADELWGMASLSLRELFDVTFGNTWRTLRIPKPGPDPERPRKLQFTAIGFFHGHGVFPRP